MTAVHMLNAPSRTARQESDAAQAPVLWRRMAWVTWRQHRVALSGVAAVLGVFSVGLWILGLHLHDAYAAAASCRPAGSFACSYPINTFEAIDDFLSNGFIFQAIPALIGAFVGAPVLARELESGTYRFAWTQAVGRWRWTVAKLVSLGVVVAAATGAFSVVLTWYYAPYFAEDNQSLSIVGNSPYFAGLFTLHGVTFAAWTLTAFAIGVVAGVLIRRVVPAIVATLAAYTGLAFAAGAFLRPRYLSPLTVSNGNVPANAWILSQWLTKGGRFAYAWPPPISVLERACPSGPSGPGGKASINFAECFGRHGYTVFVSYHPGSQYWSFQWIEAGWLFGLSALLIAATVWVVRRRAA